MAGVPIDEHDGNSTGHAWTPLSRDVNAFVRQRALDGGTGIVFSKRPHVAGEVSEPRTRDQRRRSLPTGHHVEPIERPFGIGRQRPGDDGDEVEAAFAETDDVEWAIRCTRWHCRQGHRGCIMLAQCVW